LHIDVSGILGAVKGHDQIFCSKGKGMVLLKKFTLVATPPLPILKVTGVTVGV
jgi:hypothetical protein